MPPCAVISMMRAWGIPIVRTVKEPSTITSGGPTHTAISLTRAAGIPPISTVMPPGGRMGPPTCGTTPVTIGQTCMSPIRAAGIGIAILLSGRRLPELDALSNVQALRDKALELLGGGLRVVRNGSDNDGARHGLGS